MMVKKLDIYEEVITYIVENQEKFYRLAYSYVRRKEDALDIVQNAICKALENYESLRNRNALRTWFYRILVNESISYIRKYKMEVQCGEADRLQEESSIANGTYGIAGGALPSAVYREICALPLELQHIIKLHYFEDMKLQEVAQVLDMNLNTVKAKLYRGLKKMKVCMEESEIWEK
ncbi:MAG: RNA polymerase sigma factor [Roseburia sp.]